MVGVGLGSKGEDCSTVWKSVDLQQGKIGMAMGEESRGDIGPGLVAADDKRRRRTRGPRGRHVLGLARP